MKADDHIFPLLIVFQALQQKTLGLVSAAMMNLGPTSFLNTGLKLSSTMCPGSFDGDELVACFTTKSNIY